jgi:hypothetical protein
LRADIAPLLGGAAAVGLAFVLAGSALFGPSIWRDYRARIDVTVNEKYYPNQYSLKTIFLQAAESTPSELAGNVFKPQVVKQSLDEVDIGAHRGGFLALQLALTALVLFAVAGASAMEAIAIGPFLVFIWLTVNAYYWNMLGLTALVWAARQLDRPSRLSLPLVALHASLAAYYLYQHLNWRFAEGYFMGLLLFGVFLSWTLPASARLLHFRARTDGREAVPR